MRRQVQDAKIKKHDKLVEQYLKRCTNRQSLSELSPPSDIFKKDREPPSSIALEKAEIKQLVTNAHKRLNDVELFENDKIPDQIQKLPSKSEPEKDLEYVNGSFTEQRKHLSAIFDKPLVEETEETEETEIITEIEETEAGDQMKAGVIEEEIISEEIIKIEAEDKIQGEVFNEHCYAHFTPSLGSKEIENLSREGLTKGRDSPVIDVVKIVEEETIEPPYVEPPYVEPEVKPVFPMRSIEAESCLVWNVLRRGIDNEDLKYLKSAFDSLLLLGSSVVNGLHWSSHPGILSYI